MTEVNWQRVLSEASQSRDIGRDGAAWAMNQIMAGATGDATIGAFLMAMRTKGETAHEIEGMVEAILANAVTVTPHAPAVDVVGTGGDGMHSVNISTMAALVVAGTGVPVLKHGNRAISSRAGTADVLEALGVSLNVAAHDAGTCLAEAGIAFCFAPSHHPGFRHAGPVRKELGVPTIFNVLGPLCNPGQPPAALLGCADMTKAPVLAEVQRARGFSAIVVRSEQGLDEISTMGGTHVWDVTTDEVRYEVIEAEHLGLTPASIDDLRGGSADENADVVRDVLAGSQKGRLAAIRDVVAVNAAAALVAFDATRSSHEFGSPQEGLVVRLPSALKSAYESIDSGAAAASLSSLIDVTARLATSTQ